MGSISPDPDLASLPPPAVRMIQVRTGKIRPLGGVSLRSAIAKIPREGPIRVGPVGLEEDEQQYEHHGGIDKALHQYSAQHYAAWASECPPSSARLFVAGGFGENLVTEHLHEGNVCIGDIYRIGTPGHEDRSVLVQISEPRQPCYKLNHRFEWKKTAVRTQENGRTGWYLRVLRTGHIQAGDEMVLLERPNPKWSISRVLRILYKDMDNRDAVEELSRLPGLGAETMGIFLKRLEKGAAEDMTNRLEGMPGRRVAVMWRSYKLTKTEMLTSRIKKFVFDVVDELEPNAELGLGLFPHVRLKFGPDMKFARAYSVVTGNLRSFELGVARDDGSRGGSVWVHDRLQVGDLVSVAKGFTAPEGVFKEVKANDSDAEKHRHIIVIGGIGVTAFLPLVQNLAADPASRFEIHYAVRTRQDAAYLEMLPKDRTTVYAKDAGQRLDVKAIIPDPKDDKNTITSIYGCGPNSLLMACREYTTSLNYPKSNVYYEDFGGAAPAEGTVLGDPFEVEIKKTGAVLPVPAEKSLLDILNEVGLEVPSSCLVGNCGVCMVDYCNGKVIHKGIALMEDDKATSLLSCVSRGEGRVLVDL